MTLQEANCYSPDHTTPWYLHDLIFGTLKLKPGDVFFDLGSGNGEVVEEAYRRGAKAFGVEINSEMVKDSRKRFPNCVIIEDYIENVDLSKADCIYMFLDVSITNRIGHEKIIKGCKIGTRIVSLVFSMFGFEPSDRIYIGDIGDRFEKTLLYLYKMPLKFIPPLYSKSKLH